MNIEIRKAGFLNKGAQLMLISILRKLREFYPEARFVITATSEKGDAPYSKRSTMGLYQKPWYLKKGILFGNLFKIIPKRIRLTFGIILNNEVDVVIDASGFAYSDQWGTNSIREFAQACRIWKRNNTLIIMLPQSFGPFEIMKNKKNFKKILKSVDLIFARDKTSYKEIISLYEQKDNIFIYPDFTNLISGKRLLKYNMVEQMIGIIPNARMIDRNSNISMEQYVSFLKYCINYFDNKNLNSIFIIHDNGQDCEIAKETNKVLERKIEIIHEEDPVIIKGVIGMCKGIISSRFHGLVSALSEGVPSLGTGWSHKYKELFDSYSYKEGLIDSIEINESLNKKLDLLTDPKKRSSINNLLMNESKEQKRKSEEMWGIVNKRINRFIKEKAI